MTSISVLDFMIWTFVFHRRNLIPVSNLKRAKVGHISESRQVGRVGFACPWRPSCLVILQGCLIIKHPTRQHGDRLPSNPPLKQTIPVDRPDASPSAHYCNCKLKLRKVGNPRASHANNNDDDVERMLFLPVALNPLMEKAKLSTECVTYHGTIALLEQYPSTYLTDPPTLEADVVFIVYYRDAEASLTATPMRAELLSITIASSTGVKMQDFLDEMHRGERFECDVFGPYDPRFKGRMFEGGEWDRQRQPPTLAGVESLFEKRMSGSVRCAILLSS